MTQDRFFAKGAVYPFDGTPAPFPLSHSPPSFTGNTSSKGKYTGGTIEENQVHSYNMRKTVIGGHPMKKLLILCVLLLAALLSGCAAEPLQGQTAGNTPKAPTPQEGTPASFEPVSTEPNAPTEAVDPADSMPNEDKHESGPAISSEPVSAPTESNAPASEEAKQPPVLPEKPEKAESPKEEPSVPAISEPEPTPKPEPTFDIEHWISYAKSTAVSLGLTLDSSATDCWDNPITAKPTCIYLERDINSRLNRYAKDGEITAVWIWYECVGTSSYLIYIGYA